MVCGVVGPCFFCMATAVFGGFLHYAKQRFGKPGLGKKGAVKL